ncbi:MAG: enoyl-CoA hydratase [Sphingomonadales bacterium 32-68-7]|nr:MAG: enoyl-CoA hydratase [Sphingomonadales bacterium 12-68-11]OYX10259.1 MAG: enoyl-CoA hydratase [Sphingomonadales bacterium 32-68-7]
MSEFETIRTERVGAVTLVTLDRPQALNALSSLVLEELIAAFAAFEADPAQRCAVLTGAGEKAFAAGADIKEMAERPFAEFYAGDVFARWQSHLVRAVRKPWIAAVNGFALGGGCELAMMADFIVAADSAKFGQPEIKLGVVPGMGGSQRLTRAIGRAKAMDLILTGRMIDAAEAERAGLVARVVPAAELRETSLKIAAEIAAMPPLAVLAAKELVNAAEQLPLEEGIRLERRLFHLLAGTEDKAEGMAAFVAKRPAVWKGR